MLVVTLATDQFRHLLFNFLCFMHHRLDPTLYPPGSYLVVTSSTKLAKTLSERGVIVLLLKRDKDGLFSNLQSLDLLLSTDVLNPVNATNDKDVIAWGSLHYQALMLERTLVTASLVGMLAEANSRPAHSDATCKPTFARFGRNRKRITAAQEQVGGVLLVDNDAVWSVVFLINLLK